MITIKETNVPQHEINVFFVQLCVFIYVHKKSLGEGLRFLDVRVCVQDK